MSTPWSAKYIASVTTTGCTRRIVIIRPVKRPVTRPAPRTSGTATAPPSPCGASQTTYTQFVNTTRGEIERSNPPPMIAGALASAAIVTGAAIASWSDRPKFPLCWISVAITRATSSSAENAYVLCRARSVSFAVSERRALPSDAGDATATSDIALRPEVRGHESLARDLAAVELLEQLVLAEHEHAVHQLDVLVELGGQHD